MYDSLKKDIINFNKVPEDSTNLQNLYNSFYNVYKDEMNNFIQQILLQPESSFIQNFYMFMMKLFSNVFEGISWNNENIMHIIHKIESEFYKTKFKEIFALIMNGYKNELLHPGKNPLTFIKHCSENNVAYHICGGRFAPIFKDSNVSYVVCMKCKEVFDAEFILMICEKCKEHFYSSYVTNLDMKYPPATWKKYHCDIVLNQKMQCIKCGDVFRVKDENTLFCNRCQLQVASMALVWKCIKCHQDFKSDIKPYNPLEFKIVKIAVKFAMFHRELVKPKAMNCGCKFDSLSIDFRHNKNCNGKICLGHLKGKEIVVCGVCGCFSGVKKFDWWCPKCDKKFKCSEIIVLEDLNGKEVVKKSLRKKNIVLSTNAQFQEEETKERKENEKPKIFRRLGENDKSNVSKNNSPNNNEKNKLFYSPPPQSKRIKTVTYDNTFKLSQTSQKRPSSLTQQGSDGFKEINQPVNKTPVEQKIEINFSTDTLKLVSQMSPNHQIVSINGNKYSFITLPNDQVTNSFLMLKPNKLNIYSQEKNNQNPNELYVLCEPLYVSLTNEYAQRVKKSEPFSEKELLSILENSVRAIKALPSGLKLTTNNFYKDSEMNFKYLPYEISDNGVGFPRNEKDPIRSLGLILLLCATLNQKGIESLIREEDKLAQFTVANLRNKYSENICNLIAKMVPFDTKKRINIDLIIDSFC